MSARPSFQFYPGDWLHDAALRSVSVGARGAWIEMICLMHQGSSYGHLKVNHKVILPPNLARMIGATLPETEGWLSELGSAGVFSVDDDGAIYSKRMIRDEEVRKARADGGKMGGNPNLKQAVKVMDKVNLNGNLRPTPSSSSSSSSSSPASSESILENIDCAAETATLVITPKRVTTPDCPHSEIIDLYHDMLPMCPRIKSWTDARQKSLRTRWTEDSARQSLAYWGGLFRYISASDFLCGRGYASPGREPFLVSLEWIAKSSNFVNIVEGKYHSGKKL